MPTSVQEKGINKVKRILPSVALVVLYHATAYGSLVVESETSGIVNNTPDTAQSIAPADFTTPVPSTVFNPPGWVTATIEASGGSADVDFFSFSTGEGDAMFDMDNSPSSFDSTLSLFNSAGTLIAISGDSVSDPGSAMTTDPFIGIITLSPGSYFVAISRAGNSPNGYNSVTQFFQLVRPDGKEGDNNAVGGATVGDPTYPSSLADGLSPYTLHISLENAATTAVPEASSFLVWSFFGTTAVVGLKARRWIARKFVRSSDH